MQHLGINQSYWENRYLKKDTGWDIGYISTPLKTYIDQLTNKASAILIPGCGNGYEGQYLFENGFTNTFVADYAAEPLQKLKQRLPTISDSRLLNQDFFKVEGKYDLILEQTFFCALDPGLRKAYAEKMHSLLNPNGKLVGLFFDDILNQDKPPFGGTEEEYRMYLEPYFEIKLFERCYNSIESRTGRELFLIAVKK